MREQPQVTMQFPRPGPVLKFVLVVLAVMGVGMALVFNWLPGGAFGANAFMLLACVPERVLHGEVWRLFTAGLLTSPVGFSHLLFTLVGLYFLTPDLEKRWGGARLARFIVLSVVVGNVLAVALWKVAQTGLLHPEFMFGAGAAITATAVAWSRENADREVRLFFVLPVKGKHLFWLTVLYCVAAVLFHDAATEGVAAPFGGVVVGLLLGGSPSPLRALYLQTKLSVLQRQAGSGSQRTPAPKPARRPRPGAPPLRVVQGGLEEELSKREPPKDKRYLN
jgi:membrane associated rhomboid family serine protease